MKVTVVARFAVLALALASFGSSAGAVDATSQIEARNKAFLAAYEDGNVAKMKSEIAKAISIGEKSGLTQDPTNPVMADTFVLAAILEVDGNENTAAGVKYFVKALKLKPNVAIPKGMATSPVKAALKQARAEAGLAPKEGAPPAVAATPTPPPEAEKAEAPVKPDESAEKAAAAEKQRAAEAARQEAARQEVAKQEAARQQKDAQARDEARAREEKQARAERDKQLADLKGRLQQLEKDRADRDKLLAERDKQLADLKGRLQQLEKDKADRDKLLAEKDKQVADKDRLLADARGRESKEREAREKIEREREVAAAKEREIENKRKQQQQDRERLFAGPEMPGRLSEALTCAVPDEAPLRTDLFVHCVARPNVKARSIVFYYRAGTSHYYSVPMERTTKGWYAAIIPGGRVIGKSMQYYAEALDGREAVVARNGKEASPNILTLRPSAPRS